MKKNQLTFIFILFIAALSVISCKKSDPEPVADPDIEKIRIAVEHERDTLQQILGHTVPSISVIISTPSKTLFACAASGPENVLTTATNFRFASNTKTFTATAILKMQQDGWLDIHHRIIDIIPGSAIPYIPGDSAWNIPYKDQITIEQLLQHSAGVYDVTNNPVPNCEGKPYEEYILAHDPTHQFSAAELVGQNALYQLSFFAPGSGFTYTNTGYTILGEIIARVYSFRSGMEKGYHDYLYDHICGPSSPHPLQISFPHLASDTWMPAPYVKGTLYLDSIGNPEVFTSANMSGTVAEGNGYCTLSTLNIFVRTLMKGQNVLNAASVELMQKDGSSTLPIYGLGCFYKANMGYGHNGTSQTGYLSLMAYDPDTDVSVVAMMPLVDITKGEPNLSYCMLAIYNAAYAARSVLGYPGNPAE